LPVELAPAALPAARDGDSPHLPALDGVRGIAIILVLLLHVGAIVRDTWIVRYLSFGWIGVDLFFVLSGFLITGILLRTAGSRKYYRRFYIRRGLRIWPVYYVYVAATLLLIRVLARYPHGFPVEVVSPFWFFLLFIQNLNPASLFCFRDSLFSVTWSLCIEEHFYLAWPTCVRNLSRRMLMISLGTVLALSPLLRLACWWIRGGTFSEWYQTITRFTPLHLDSIALGCVLGVLWTREQDSSRIPKIARWFPWWFLGGLAGTATCLYFQSRPGIFSFCFSALAIMFAGFLGLALDGRFRAVLLNAPLRYVGKISYGLYLIHPLIFVIFQSHRILQHFGLDRHPALVEAAAAIVAVAISLVLAAFSWEVYEKRALQLKSVLAP
jgi:peptidoglycan/LPS O-acetylase OafA/YrhL